MPKWTKDHDLRMQRILDSMRREAQPFPDASPEAAAARRSLPADEWNRTYLPHYFTSPSAAAHLLADDLVEERGMPLYLCWARGYGKSVRYSLARPLHWVLHRERRFVIFGGRTEEVAADKMSFLALELKENPRLRQDYGEKIAPGKAQGDDTDVDFVANGVRVWARGIGQSPRGQRHGPHRPDAFVGDDLEDDQIARSPDREQNLYDWLTRSIFPALLGAGADSTIAVLSTMYGRHCLMARAKTDAAKTDPQGRPLCRYQEFPAETADGRSAWPEHWPLSALQRARAIMGERAYRIEMLCRVDDESAAFKPEWFEHTFDSARFPRERAQVAVYCDPSAKPTAIHDPKAIAVVACLPDDDLLYCLHAWIRHGSALDMLRHLTWCYRAFLPGRIACEENGFQTLLWPLLKALKRSGDLSVDLSIPLSPVTHTASKEDRILALAPFAEHGMLVFDPAEGDQKLLIDQFLDYGSIGVHDDGPDAYEAARALLAPARSGPVEVRHLRRTNYDAFIGRLPADDDDPHRPRRRARAGSFQL